MIILNFTKEKNTSSFDEDRINWIHKIKYRTFFIDSYESVTMFYANGLCYWV